MRLTGVKRPVTSLGDLPAVRMAWDTLGMGPTQNTLTNPNAFAYHRRPHPVVAELRPDHNQCHPRLPNPGPSQASTQGFSTRTSLVRPFRSLE